jgi:dsRNA-specific ribonuclease
VKPVYAMVQDAIGADNMKLMLAEVAKAEKAVAGAKGGDKKAAPKKQK